MTKPLQSKAILQPGTPATNIGHVAPYAFDEQALLGNSALWDAIEVQQAIIGTKGNDNLTGTSGDDVIDGLKGADTMSGGTGNYRYIVDNVKDVVIEAVSAGIDTVEASVNYTLADNIENLILTGSAKNGTGNQLNNRLVGNDSDNLLDGGIGADTLTGGRGNDTYTVNSDKDVVEELAEEGIDTVQSSTSYTLTSAVENLVLLGKSNLTGTGNSEANLLTGNKGNNLLQGLAGNDSLVGAGGADTLVGGMGNDVYEVDSTTDVVTEVAGEGNDTVRASFNYQLGGNVENLVLIGTAALSGTGNSQANVLTGNSASNVLNGMGGQDTLIGGNGDDTYWVDDGMDVIIELNGEGADSVRSTVSYQLTSGVESLTLLGTGAIDAIGNADKNLLTGNEAANLMDGAAGSDTLIGGGGNDRYVVDDAGDVITEAAGGGYDTVSASISYRIQDNVEALTLTGSLNIDATGNTSANLLTGNSGANALDGGAGADTMVGALGDDLYTVDALGDVVTELDGEGTDTVRSSITYQIGAAVENLTLLGKEGINGTGNGANNLITGNDAANVLDGALGADTLAGGLGNDQYMVDNEGDLIVESADAGTDTVTSSISYVLSDNTENLVLSGSMGINATGNALANKLTGNAAANILIGGLGADTLNGGAGDDIYEVDDLGDVVTESIDGGQDTIRSSISFKLALNTENLELTGTADVNATGNLDDNVLKGNSAANILDGSSGNDSMSGGLGNDTYYVDTTGDKVIEKAGEGNDLVVAEISYALNEFVENLTLQGTNAIDGTGNAGNNLLTGNAAANVLDGAAGADTMIGGEGDDSYLVDNAGDIVTELADGGYDVVRANLSYQLRDNIEALVLTGTLNIDATGNSGANLLTGNVVANTLDGGASADTMVGGLGDDLYKVDDQGDVVTEVIGEGLDTVQSSVSYMLGANVENLVLSGSQGINATGNALANRLTGNAAANVLSGGLGADTMTGGAGNDIYEVDDLGDVVVEAAGGGQDTIRSLISLKLVVNTENLELTGTADIDATGNQANNTLIGNAGANILDGASGNDTMSGGQGHDTYYVDSAGDKIIERADEGDDLVVAKVSYALSEFVENLTLSVGDTADGNSLNNQITGNLGANTLRGNGGNDTLLGLAGNDTLDGGLGIDSMVGGIGDDFYYIDNSADIISELSDQGTDSVYTAVSFSLGDNLERMALTGTSDINGYGNVLDNFISGNQAKNALYGGAGQDSLSGLDNSDTLYGEDGADWLDGGNDNDSLNGGDGADQLVGGTGDDWLDGGAHADRLDGGYGNDTLFGGASEFSDTLDGGNGSDSLDGGAGDDLLSDMDDGLSSSSDTINGGDGTDKLDAIWNTSLDVIWENNPNLARLVNGNLISGIEQLHIVSGSGNDIFTNLSTGTADYLSTGEGNDLVRSGGGDDVVLGDYGQDTLDGGSGNDQLFAAGPNSLLLGGTGNDELSGSGTLDGGADSDLLTGGDGNDTLLGGEGDASDTLNGGSGSDLLLGGGGDDFLQDEWFWQVGRDDTLDGGSGTDMLRARWQVSTAIIWNNDLTHDHVVNGNTIRGIEIMDLVLGSGDDQISNLEVNANDMIEAGAGDDWIRSGAGLDQAWGDLGNDTLEGGLGDDSLHGGDNQDSLDGGDGHDSLNGDDGDDTLIGGEGDDYLSGDAGTDRLFGGSGNDILNASSGDLIVDGGAGTDLLQMDWRSTAESIVWNRSSTESIVILGTSIADIESVSLSLGSGADTILSSHSISHDTLLGGAGNDLLEGGMGDDLLDGESDNDTLRGEGGNDTLDGSYGSDLVEAGAGDDTVWAASLAQAPDTLLGGEGFDLLVASWSGSSSNIVFQNDSNPSLVVDGTTISGFERLQIIGGEGQDHLSNLLVDADDVLFGEGGSDTLEGGGGSDSLSGGEGSDRLDGGLGNDSLEGGNAVDVLIGAEGDDRLDGGSGSDALYGGGGDDLLIDGGYFANSESDTIQGGEGHNYLWADWSSAKTVITWNLDAGTDQIVYGNTIGGIEGLDLLLGIRNDVITNTQSTMDCSVNGNEGNDRLELGLGTDTLYGGLGNDWLSGGAGNDFIQGEDGNDTLIGGAGSDRVSGGQGSDVFVLDSLNGSDIFQDFASGSDLLRFSASNLPVGDADKTLEGATVIASPGGFSSSAELVICSTAITGAFSAEAAANAIGNATSAYAVGQTALFTVHNGSDSAVYYFKAADANATVSADELTLLTTLLNTAHTTIDDYVLGP